MVISLLQPSDGNSQTHTKLLMATPDQVDEIQSAEQTALETQLQMEGEHVGYSVFQT